VNSIATDANYFE